VRAYFRDHCTEFPRERLAVITGVAGPIIGMLKLN
jgi:hypothetical protein